MVFDIHQVKLGRALQKTVSGGLTISSFFGGTAVFSTGTLGSDQTFQILERFLIDQVQTLEVQNLVQTLERALFRLSRPYLKNNPDPRPCADQTITTLGGALIRLCRQ